VGDFNGDGRDDLLTVWKNTGNVATLTVRLASATQANTFNQQHWLGNSGRRM